MNFPRNIVLIGATGSIGESTLEVLRAHPGRLRLLGAAAHRNQKQLEAVRDEFQVPHTSLYAKEGIDGLLKLATLPEADVVLVASTGTVALEPTLAAIQAGKTIALASKEIMVLAGSLVMEEARRYNARLLPVDSEHNAIFQCLEGFESPEEIDKVFLTASGGPFREWNLKDMEKVTARQALKHPNWDMGPKITIDSATMANKGLEIIEAKWLFNLDPNKIEVLIHPQSIIHSMVQGIDGSVLAQLCPPSMTYPLQHALFYPERWPATQNPGNFLAGANLEFHKPNLESFPCLRLAMEVIRTGGTAPAIYNSANEIAVDAFLENSIPFLAIPRLIEQSLNIISIRHPDNLDEILEAEKEARRLAEELLQDLKI